MQPKLLKYILDVEIGLRNIVSHADDSVEPEMLWGVIQNNIAVLADEIKELKNP